jgi:phage/plasmid-associated DNA primase
LKRVNIAQLWLEWDGKRKYNGLVFDPTQSVSKQFYNLYQPPRIEPKLGGSWKLFKGHIFEVICGADEEIFKYVLGWVARLIQDPGGQRPGVAIVLKGKQGTGKGTFVKYISKLVEPHFAHVSSQERLTGRFNSILEDTLLLFLDEAIWAGDKRAEGELKRLITEDTIVIERKGLDSYPVKNYLNIIIASNNDWIVPAGLQERRMLVLEVSDKYMQDKKYFRAIEEEMDNGGLEAMYYDLLNFDYSKIDLRTPPKTKALSEQVINSMNSIEAFYFELLYDGVLPGVSFDAIDFISWDEKAEIRIEEMYNAYLQFCKEKRYFRSFVKNIFSKKLRELCPRLKIIRRRINGVNTRFYLFPSLKEARREFEEHITSPIDWDEHVENEEEDALNVPEDIDVSAQFAL